MVDLNAAYNEAKYLPDDALRKELEKGSGTIPGYIILAELQDRKAIRTSSAPSVKRGSIASEYMFSKGGQVAAINPFNAYVNGLKFYKRLDQTPEPETQKEEGLPSLAMPGDPMMPPELSSLVPLPPGDPNNPVVKKYASGGLASLPQGTRYAYQYYLEKGLPPALAAGMAGNFHVESGGLSADVISGARRGDQGTAFGAGQWRGKRLDNLKHYAASTGRSHTDITAQLDFPLQEMNANSRYADDIAASSYNNLLASKTPGQAAATFMNKFERPSSNPAVNHVQRRMDVANLLAGSPMERVAAPLSAPNPGSGIMSPGLMGAPVNLAGQTAQVANQMAQQKAGTFTKNPGAGLLGLMMMSAAMKPQPPAPAPISGKPSKFRRDTDPEEMTALTSQTPNAYRRRRYG